MRLGFNMAKIQLSDHEYDLLVTNFHSDTKPGYVYWQRICDKIDEVHNFKELEKNPGFEKHPINLKFVATREKMTAREKIIAEKMKLRFRNYSKGTRLDVKQFFKDWDRLGKNQVTRNKVSPKQFR